jgi:succinyl-diaminopimelate desuccinylase
MINKERLVKLTQSLIQINSENPGSTEYEITCFIKNYLKPYGIKTKIYEFQNKRSNLLAYLGERGKCTLLITSHLDTVPAGKSWHYPAFGGVIYKGRIYGRGAVDDKGNLAVALEAMMVIKEENVGLNYQLILAATADEESGSRLGIIPLLDKKIIRPNFSLVMDSGDFNIITSQKGLIHLRVSIFGKKAHGAYPWLGENAIEKAVCILKEIKDYKFRFKMHPLLKPPTINMGTIQGGDRVNIVSDWCQFSLDIRFLPGMSEKQILKDIKKIIKKYTKKFKIEIMAIQKPFQINKDNPLLVKLSQALKKNKINFSFRGSEGATVLTFFNERGIPAVGFGVGKTSLSHASDEYVEIEDLYKGAKVLSDFLKDFD